MLRTRPEIRHISPSYNSTSIPPLTKISKTEGMKKVSEEILSCRRCGLCEGRLNPVVGEGNLDSNVFLIGEAPGRWEDRAGRPFVGAAGRLLDRLLNNIGIKREEVYISNVVKCRPPNNRRPRTEEISACSIHLGKQLDVIDPRFIAPMGNSATGYFMKRLGLKPITIGRIHGQRIEPVDRSIESGRAVLFPLYHPAAALYNKDLEKVLEKDFFALKSVLERL